MSSLLDILLGMTLEEAGKQIGLSTLCAGSAKLFSLIVNADKNLDAKTQDELNEILKGLDGLHSGIKDLENQLARLELSLNNDLVQTLVDKLKALYTDYVKAYKELAAAALLKPSTNKTQRRDAARKNVTELGTRVKYHVFGYVDAIHTFVAGQGTKSPLELANEEAAKCDFFTYFCRMKTRLLSYWVIQLQESLLLHLVSGDPVVGFTDGPALIDKVNSYTKEQERFFLQLVPSAVMDLASMCAKTQYPTAGVPVQFQSLKGVYIWGSQGGSPDLICPTAAPIMTPWIIHPIQPWFPIDLKATRYYELSIVSGHLVPTSPGRWRVVTMVNNNSYIPSNPDLSWLIMSTADNRFKLQYWYRGTAPAHGFDGGYLPTSNQILTIVPKDASPGAFMITPLPPTSA